MTFLNAGPSRIIPGLCLLIAVVLPMMANAQSSRQSIQKSASAAVPRLVNFSGRAVDGAGKIVTGVAGVTFAIYEEQSGGAPLWMEAQNTTADAKGNYTVQLGANTPEGLPLELFATGAARWLGIRINGGEEQPRVLLLSVPYALKAADAETFGGLPPSAFVLAGTPNTTRGNAASQGSAGVVSPQLAGTGTADFVPLWTDNSGDLGNSVLFQSGTGSTAKVGINTNTPVGTLDVNGNEIVRGNLNFPVSANATASAGVGSRAAIFNGSAFNSSTSAAVTQTFAWQVVPTGNNTATPAASMILLSSAGINPLKRTGLGIASNGQIAFAPGQTFPASTVTGNETVQGSVSAAQLISTAPQGTPPLQVNSTTQVANLNASLLGGQPAGAFATVGPNAFVGNETITGSVGVGTTTPATTLDVFSATAGIHAPIAKFGSSSTTDSDSILTYNGSGTTEMFQSGCAGCFVPGAQAGDGGIRVSLGKNIFFGDSGTSRLRLDSIGNASQPRTANGMVKAMISYIGASDTIDRCFNSTLSGTAATTPPCGFSKDKTGFGDYVFDFGFEVDDRFYSISQIGFEPTVDTLLVCHGTNSCTHTLTSNKLDITTRQGSGFSDAAFTLIVY